MYQPALILFVHRRTDHRFYSQTFIYKFELFDTIPGFGIQTILYYYHLFFIIFYSLTLLAALPFLPIVTKISGWTRPDRQPCLSFYCYAPEHINIWLYSDYSSISCTVLVLSPYYSPDQKGKRPLSLVMHPSILQQDGHWTDPYSQTTINVTQQEIANISRDCF